MFLSICIKTSLQDNQILFPASNRCSGLCGLITRIIVCWKHSSVSIFSFKGQLHHFHFQPFSTLLIFMSFHEECCILPDKIKAKTWNKKSAYFFLNTTMEKSLFQPCLLQANPSYSVAGKNDSENYICSLWKGKKARTKTLFWAWLTSDINWSTERNSAV